ncbi:MAG: hypothetical protein AB2421_19520 [Thermotaleaceae bacterium]
MLIGNTIIPIGELDGKESVEIDYQLDNALNNQRDYNYLSYIYEKADLKSYQRQLLDYYFYQIEDGRNILKLFGFSKEERELQVDRKVQHVQQIALNVFDISMENNEGIVFYPMGAIQPIMLQNEGSENPHRKETLLEAGKDKILYYALPKEMLISEIQIIAKGEGSDFGIEVFNHTSHRWQPLSNKVLEQGYIEALGIKGLLLLKVEGNGRMILPQISLKGRK